VSGVPAPEIAVSPPKVVASSPGDAVWSIDFGEVIKIVATRCQILRLKCTIYFGCSSALDPTGEVYSTPQTTWLDLRDLLLKGGRGEKRKGEEDQEGRERKKCRVHHLLLSNLTASHSSAGT